MTIKGKTSSGFEYEVDAAVLDDMELIDALSETLDENPVSFSVVCTKLLGKDQKKRLYAHLRNEEGRVPVQAVSEAIADIFNSFGEAGKNS